LREPSYYAGDKIIFKGGTILFKGWNLIARFSEDIDIFLDPIAFQPSLGKNSINREPAGSPRFWLIHARFSKNMAASGSSPRAS
jgi:hypothetical protein